VFVKICGLRTPEAVEAAVAAGADAVGFVFVPGARRRVGVGEARKLAALARGLERVGVFHGGQSAEEIRAVAEAVGLDTVQLHGADEALAAALRGRFRVARSWRPGEPWPAAADRVLAEMGEPGTGRSWDWGRVRGLPVVIAGGLTPENVAAAMEAARPVGVDVSSGVETAGEKDPERIRAFCQAVRRWEDERGGEGPKPVAG
jgi:phosphoribosylanthranilate isomerase